MASNRGDVVSEQKFDPWGKVRSSTGTMPTKLNYTGQRLDGTGLLYYHARMYDPVFGRFISPDTVIQGASSLMTGFHEMNTASEHTGKGGPPNPGALNRYSYVLNNPLGHIDPSGHAAQKPPLVGDKGDYKTMLNLTYNKMKGIIGGSDSAFNAISGTMAVSNTMRTATLGVTSAGETAARRGALDLFIYMVDKDHPWDVKKDLRDAFGAGETDLFFDAHGKTDVAYSLFGNILYGYVGAAAGLTTEEIMDIAWYGDYMGDPKGANLPDLVAAQIGMELWNTYGSGLTMEQLDATIALLLSHPHDIFHTRSSIQNRTWHDCGLQTGIRKCSYH